MKEIEIIEITPDNILDYGVCGYKSLKREGYPEKVSWIKHNYPHGLRIKSILSKNDGVQGMIEYIPGEHCWRPVDSSGFLFIHCLFVGFKSAYKGKGYASLLIDECLQEAKNQNKNGVAVVTRKGSFMVGNEIFLKKGFDIIDTAPPDFELLVKKFQNKIPTPKFKGGIEKRLNKYKKGLTIIRADQCPYTKKNVIEIMETAKQVFDIKPKLIELKTHEEAQESPCAFGTFCIVYDGEVISYHPISNKRFSNIMNSLLK
ncbi:MAG: GNAT family N-acetyltransferase [Candidatus Aminicenantales bacterium]